MTGRIEWRDVEAKANGVWSGILEHFGIEVRKLGQNGPCPLCQGNDRQHFYERDGRILSYCRGGCGNSAGGEVSTPEYLLMQVNRWSFPEMVKNVADYLDVTPREQIYAIRREHERRKSKPLSMPASHREDKEKAMQALEKCEQKPTHPYLMSENTAPSDHALVLKGLLAVEMVSPSGELVNVAALRNGAWIYSAGGESFGSTARLKPEGDHDGTIILCQDYAAAWRLWWARKGQSEVRCALSPENFRWMLGRARDQFTHVAALPEDASELEDLGHKVIGLVQPYRKQRTA